MRFRVLGPVEVRTAAGWTDIGAPKWRAVLACLLLRAGQIVPTDSLIDELWGDTPPARAANLVSVYVLRLRRLLGDADGQLIVTHAPGYLLRRAPDDLDSARFETLTRAGRAALDGGDSGRAATLLRDALDLWRGPPLADVPPSRAVAAEVERLEELRLVATELRVRADLGCGRHGPVVPELRRLLADHPLSEGLWLLLMRALDGAGRRAEALEVYGQARTVIADQLGVDPGPELRQFFQRLLSDDASPPRPAADAAGSAAGQGRRTATGVQRQGTAAARGRPARADPVSAGGADGPRPNARPVEPAPRQLPADIVDFTGREDHLRHLCDLLSAGSGPDNPGAVPVAVVAAAGGVGKTTLAVHAAHRLRGRYPDGQLYINLLGATEQPLTPSAVLGRFLRDLGVPDPRIPPGEDERAALLRTRLDGRRVLVVLDDAADAAQVRPLLPGSASCAVLVTSRSRLPGLAGGRLVPLDVLDDEEARALLRRIVGADRLAAEPEATAELLACCAGLPLAIRICGARLAARTGWTVRTLTDRLRDKHRRLDELAAGDLAVRASFEVSFAALAAAGDGRGQRGTGRRGPRADEPTVVDPARAFRLLGLWQGHSIAVDAAAALVGQREDRTADALETLVDAHLLESPAPDRYRFHDLLRVYAADRARSDEPERERAAAVRRVLTWYLHTTEAAARVISPYHTRVPLDPAPTGVNPRGFASLDEALDWCETERHALLAATRQAAEYGEHEIAWKLPAAAMSFYYRRSHWSDWTTTHQIGLTSARTLHDKLAEAWMLNNLGMAFGQQRMNESVDCFKQALALYRALGDAHGETRAANNLANAYFDLDRHAEAFDGARRSLEIQRRAHNRYGEGIALGILGGACRQVGRFDEAIDNLSRALVIFRDLGVRDGEADALSDLGDAYLGAGRVEEAQDCLREALAIWRTTGDRHGEAATLNRLAVASDRSGDPEEARDLLSHAVRILEELGDDVEADKVRAGLAEQSGQPR